MIMSSVLCIIAAYVIGSIPCGYLIGRLFYHVDLRTLGSGNIGATNAYRNLGAKAGASVFLCDFLKGFIAAWLGAPVPVVVMACALAAILGNDFSLFLHFHGGKGISCGVGAFTFISPPAVLVAFIVWLAVFKWKHIVSLASIIATPVVVIVLFLMGEPVEYMAFAVLAMIVVIYKHWPNIKRLRSGEEKPISRGEDK